MKKPSKKIKQYNSQTLYWFYLASEYCDFEPYDIFESRFTEVEKNVFVQNCQVAKWKQLHKRDK